MKDLLDARGYEIEVTSSADCPVTIIYLGPKEAQHEGIFYEEDPYVVSRVEQKSFNRRFCTALKDEGIRLSGLRISLKAEEQTEIEVRACGECLLSFTAEPGRAVEMTTDVSGLCKKEKEYLSQVHRILYLLLGEVDRICQKHKIPYFLVFGGLLGSLRYGDIIPWDDDVDIAMTRKDLLRFKNAARKEWDGDFLLMDCSEIGNGAFLDFLCRVLYMKEPVPVNIFRKVSGKCSKEVENHLSLDIFILDRAFDHPGLHKLHMTAVRAVYGLAMGHRAYVDQKEYAGRSFLTRIAVRSLPVIGKMLPSSFIFRLHDWISTVSENKKTKDYFMSNGYLPFIHTRYSCQWFCGESRVKLGNMQVGAPNDVEAYLKRAYYDYYHYPPMEKRIPEHSPESAGIL